MVLFSLCLFCSLFGIVVIASATAAYDGGSFKYIIVQGFALIIGIILFIILTVLDIDVIADKWAVMLVVCVGLLLALIPFGEDDGTGNKSWIRFLGIGIQPSEIVKVSAKHHNITKEYEILLDHIKNDTPVKMSAREGAKTAAVCFAIIESSMTGKPVIPDYEF